MSTSNFFFKNKLYAVAIEDEHDYDCLTTNIQTLLGKMKESAQSKNKLITMNIYSSDKPEYFTGIGSNSYPTTQSGQVTLTADFMGIELELNLKILLRSGYYRDANIDYVWSLEADDALCQNNVDAQDILDTYDSDDMDIDKAYANKEQLDKLLLDMRLLALETYLVVAKSFCEEYHVTNQFSNGETFYEKSAVGKLNYNVLDFDAV